MKRLLIIIIILLVIFGAAVYLAKNSAPVPTTILPSPTPYKLETLNSWGGISPGISTPQDLVALLGKPESTILNGATTKMLYSSGNPYWKNEVLVDQKSVVFIREYLFPPKERSYKKLTATMAETPVKLFGGEQDSGFFLMTYPTAGLAYFVNIPRDVTYEIWRFQPGVLKEILSRQEFQKYTLTPSAKME